MCFDRVQQWALTAGAIGFSLIATLSMAEEAATSRKVPAAAPAVAIGTASIEVRRVPLLMTGLDAKSFADWDIRR